MKRRKMKPEKWLGLMLAVGILPFAYIVPNEIGYAPDIKNPFVQEATEARYAISYESGGHVWSYDLQTGIELSSLNLGEAEAASAAPKTAIVQASAERSPTAWERLEGMGLEPVDVIIQNRDTAWTIQRQMTPKRDIYEMIRLIRELNGGYAMHPIHAGETYTFVRESKAGASVGETGSQQSAPPAEKTEKPKDNGEEKPKEPTNQPPEKTEAEGEEKFLFEEGDGVLYAYSKTDGSVQKMTLTEKGELDREAFGRASSGSLERMAVGGNVAALHRSGESNIELLQKGEEPVTMMTAEEPVAFAVSGRHLVYSGGHTLYSMDLTTGESGQVMVGWKIVSLMEAGGKVYALASVDESNGAILKYDPDTLSQESSIEFKGSDASFVRTGNEESLGIRFKGKKGNGFSELDTRKLKRTGESWSGEGIHISGFYLLQPDEEGMTLDGLEGNKKEIRVMGERLMIVR